MLGHGFGSGIVVTAIAIAIVSSSVHRLDVQEGARIKSVDALGALNAVLDIGISIVKPA
jgi:hypothetical protein